MATRDWPIRKKLTAALLLTSGLVLLLTAVAFVSYEVYSFRQVARRNLSTLGRVIAANSTAALAFANVADATEVLGALKAEPHTLAAALYDRSGRVFATYPAGLKPESLPVAPGAEGYRFDGTRLIGVEPVSQAGGGRLGTLYIESNPRVVYESLRVSALIAAAMLALALLFAWLIASALQGRISGPIEQELRAANTELESRVQARTAELSAANAELDSFAYSVSHDLRAPLRSIDGFSQVLLEDYEAKLDEAGRDSLNRVRAASQRMGHLIDDLLRLARVSRAELRPDAVDLSAMAQGIADELKRAAPERAVEFVIAPNLTARGDAALLRVALENLLRNSWKYSAKQPRARIEFARVPVNGGTAFMVRDNGAGFDMQYAGKLFGAFQRLHSPAEFEGTGVGLATVRRIINRHRGHIWAESQVDKGATFYFSL